MKSDIHIFTDKNKIDVEFVHAFITNTYWAKGRTLEKVKFLVEHSLNFGVFLDTTQIGYARIVTDYGQFAYLMDVFIVEKYQGNGYSKILMDFIIQCPELKDVLVWRLATSDAHGLYEKFGFLPLKNPDKIMEWIKE